MQDILSTLYYGNTLAQWATAFGIIILALVVARVLYWFSSRIVKQLTSRTKNTIDDLLIDKAEEPFTAAVVLLGISYALDTLRMPEQYIRFIDNGARFIWAILVAWLLIRLYDALHETFLSAIASKTSNDLDDHILPIIRSGVRMALMALGIIVGLNNAGYDVTTVLAGLGIGGLAFALAAQDTIGNIFGGLIILLQRPFKIGDLIDIDGKWMIVRQVGLRSSTMQDYATGYRLTIPNSQFTNRIITNISSHAGHWAGCALQLSPLTRADTLQQVIAGIGELLRTIPEIDPATARVYFSGFAQHALEIKLFYNATTFADRVRVGETINFGVLRVLEQLHVDLLLPMYLAAEPTNGRARPTFEPANGKALQANGQR